MRTGKNKRNLDLCIVPRERVSGWSMGIGFRAESEFVLRRDALSSDEPKAPRRRETECTKSMSMNQALVAPVFAPFARLVLARLMLVRLVLVRLVFVRLVFVVVPVIMSLNSQPR